MAAIVPIVRYFNPTLAVTLAGQAVQFRNGEGLTVRFSVARSTAPTPDTATIEIVGLDPLRAKAMSALFRTTGVAKLIIKAGYDGLTAGVFAGDVRELWDNQRDGPDLILTATADDGGDAVADVPFQRTTAGLTAAEMVQVAAAAMKLVVHPSTTKALAAADPSRQGPYTSVVAGKAADLLDAAARRIRARWWVRDGQIFMSGLGQVPVSRPAVLLNERNLVREPAFGGSGTAEFEALLDPNIVPGSQVAHLAQHYRVEAVTHHGATRGGLLVSQIRGRVL